jgi:hypothetical protein
MSLILPDDNPNDIPGVIALMTAIDGELPDNDGVKWFNRLYLIVTQQINEEPASSWKEPKWLTKLDVIFAGRYFNALRDNLNDEPPAKSWQALFESRYKTRIDRIQFALAGMNAHINHDLAWALLAVNIEFSVQPSLTSRQHNDFEKVNAILEASLPEALAFLDTDELGELADRTGLIGRLLGLWNVNEARDLAWTFSTQLRALNPALRGVASDAQDQLTGVIGRALLLPIDPIG